MAGLTLQREHEIVTGDMCCSRVMRREKNMVAKNTDFGATHLVSNPSVPSRKSLNSSTPFLQLKNRANNNDDVRTK